MKFSLDIEFVTNRSTASAPVNPDPVRTTMLIRLGVADENSSVATKNIRVGSSSNWVANVDATTGFNDEAAWTSADVVNAVQPSIIGTFTPCTVAVVPDCELTGATEVAALGGFVGTAQGTVVLATGMVTATVGRGVEAGGGLGGRLAFGVSNPPGG